MREGYTTPTPVQAEVVPGALRGRDVMAGAQTGTGKTLAFLSPILQRLSHEPRAKGFRALILAPTRELAAQIGERIEAYGAHLGLRHAIVYGGVSQRPQEAVLSRPGLDILVATPGRLLDLLGQGFVRFDDVTYFVLDEADRMLDMGFIHDVRRVITALPKRPRQTMLFSATMPDAIAKLASSLLIDPITVAIAPRVTTAEGVEQSVVRVGREQKRALLEHVLKTSPIDRVIVFTRTKHGANRLAEQLTKGGIGALAIHGNKSQGARERALESFRAGTTRVLIATDLAARGIDVDGISHVVNYELPNVPEQYVHRIGRTGRAGAFGTALSFCDGEEVAFLRDIERFIKRRIPEQRFAGFDAGPMDAPVAAPRHHGGGQHGGGQHGNATHGGGDGRGRRPRRPEGRGFGSARPS